MCPEKGKLQPWLRQTPEMAVLPKNLSSDPDEVGSATAI